MASRTALAALDVYHSTNRLATQSDYERAQM